MTDATQQALIHWLSQADHYDDSIGQVQKIETHISAVFLTGSWAYKLKKSVNFGFLDFTSLGQRKKFCELELSLNRRTAAHLYHSVIPVYQNPSREKDFSFNPQDHWPVADYLVKMRQFDPDRVLGKYLQNHSLSAEQTQQLALAIASLHQQAEQVAPSDFLGSVDCVIEPMLDNFPSLFKLYQTLSHREPRHSESIILRLQQLKYWTQNQHTLLAPLIEQRQTQGKVRACHGDLHLDNIALIDDQPTLFDGIEFNDRFRWIDTMSDLAFLLIDLDFRNRQRLGQQILQHYLQAGGDYPALVLLRFYQTYRALVRAKITGLRLNQLCEQDPDRPQIKKDIEHYISLAEHYAYPAKQSPTLYIMQGVSGSGKSYYAQQVHQQTGALIVSSDIERKRLFGIAPLHRVDEHQRHQLYSASMNQATYDCLYQCCQAALQAGLSIVADATFLKYQHRRRFIELAHSMNAKSLTLSIQPNVQVCSQGIKEREQAQDNPSDANIAVMQAQLNQFEAPESGEPHLSIQIRQAKIQLNDRPSSSDQ